MSKKHHQEEVKEATERKRQVAAKVHTEWLQQKNAEELAKKVEELKRKAVQVKSEEQVRS